MFADNAAGQFKDCRHGHGAYGGLWTENIVSGIARDLLAEAMLRIEAAGYPIVLHVHDEIVAEVPIGFGSTEEFTRLMTRKPAWALELPIAARPGAVRATANERRDALVLHRLTPELQQRNHKHRRHHGAVSFSYDQVAILQGRGSRRGEEVAHQRRDRGVVGIGAEKEKKLVVWFTNDERGLVLNETNNRTSAAPSAMTVDGWAGKIIVMFPTTAEFRGKMVPALAGAHSAAEAGQRQRPRHACSEAGSRTSCRQQPAQSRSRPTI